MKTFAKYLLGAGAAGIGALAAVVMIPGLISESTGQSPAVATNAHADTLLVALADQPDESSEAAATFPNGATTVQESYSDWQVNCAVQGASKVCVMLQQQTSRDTQQRVLAIELASTGDSMEGALILPFGILLEQGVRLQVDDGPLGDRLPFRTCVPAGCAVPLGFGPNFTNVLVQGGILHVHATPDGRDEITFGISLRGFSAARKRVEELLG